MKTIETRLIALVLFALVVWCEAAEAAPAMRRVMKSARHDARMLEDDDSYLLFDPQFSP
jgi:hypothetical protein